jgi:predicted extracellular nuclease
MRFLTAFFCLAVLSVPLALAQTETIAYWAHNDNALPNGGFGFQPGDFPQSADVGIGQLHLIDFDETTSVTAGGDTVYQYIQSFSGTTLGALSGFSAGGDLGIQGGASDGQGGFNNNGMHIRITVDTSDLQDIQISWAQRGTSSGFTSRQLAWSDDGGFSFNDFGSDTGALGSSWVSRSYDLSAIDELNDNANVVFHITLDGATGATGNNRFDNIRVSGSPLGGIPIPYELVFTANPYSEGWAVTNISGLESWNYSGANNNVSFSAFGGAATGCVPTESWFISPGFNLDATDNERLFVDVARGFSGADNLDLFFSNDYSGSGDPNEASWTQIGTIAGSDFSGNNSPVTFGPFIQLRDFEGTGYFAARGLFDEGGNCSTWRISRFEIDIADNAGDFACVADGELDEDLTRIHAIQGDGFVSPLEGETVEVQAIVTAAFQDIANFEIGGFFLQEADANADADPLTSEGVYVAPAGVVLPPVNIGDEVRLRARVREQFGQTELVGLDAFELCATDQLTRVSPTVISFPVDDLSELEAVEGMWVSLAQGMTVTDVFNAARFAEFAVATDRLYTPTQVVSPGAAAVALQDLNERSRLIIDQGLSGDYRTPFQQGLDGTALNADNPIRIGYRIQPDFNGVMGFGFNNYRLFALDTAQFDDSDKPRPADPPALLEGNLSVASFNVENLFNTLAEPGVTCGPGSLSCRGASSESERDRQLIKLTNALLALNADVVGLVEVENDDDDATLELLVAALNAIDAIGDWAFIPTGFKGSDAIKNAIIYRADSVTPVGATAVLDSSVVISPPFNDGNQRPVLTQAFEHPSGVVFALSVIHLRSKNCGHNATGANLDQGDGQGCWNALRTESVQSFRNWLATDPTGTDTDRHLVMGDFNGYAQEDPLQVLINEGFVNQAIQANDGDPAVYSYTFFGQSGSLDHVLASPALNSQVLAAASWAINADEIPAFGYPETLPSSSLEKPADFFAEDSIRSSDHDPLLVSLFLELDPAWVQIAHLAPFAADPGTLVDIAVDGDVVLTNVAYGESTTYLPFEPGAVDIDIIPVGAIDPAISASVLLDSGVYYTVLAVGDGVNQGLDLIALVDDLAAPDAGNFQLRLGHLASFAPGAATAEIRLVDSGLLIEVDYGDIAVFELAAGSYDLLITAPGGDPVLIDPIAVDFQAGAVVSAFAVGDGDNQRLGAFALPADTIGGFIDLNANVAIENLVQTYTGDSIEVSVSTSPPDLAVEVLYAGSAVPPSDAGSYEVVVNVVEPGYVGSAVEQLTIEPAVAEILFQALSQRFTGKGLSPIVTTAPEGLQFELEFDGQAALPVEVGDYIVTATIDETNYSGSANAIFRILSSDAQALEILAQPGGSNVFGQPLHPALSVGVVDDTGEIAADDNQTVIELYLLVDPSSTSRSASAFASATVDNGVAVFEDLVISEPGSSYRLLIQDAEGELPAVISQPFDVLGDIVFIDQFEP